MCFLVVAAKCAVVSENTHAKVGGVALMKNKEKNNNEMVD